MARKKDETRGPRGGRTTRRPGRVRKDFWLPEELAEALRTEASRRLCSETSIVIEGLERVLIDAEEEEDS